MDFDGAYEYSDVETVFMESEMSSIRLFPNPVSNDKINITINEIPKETTSLHLYNMNGQLLKAMRLEDIDIEMDLSAHASGIYLLKVNNGIELWQEKIIKQ